MLQYLQRLVVAVLAQQRRVQIGVGNHGVRLQRDAAAERALRRRIVGLFVLHASQLVGEHAFLWKPRDRLGQPRPCFRVPVHAPQHRGLAVPGKKISRIEAQPLGVRAQGVVTLALAVEHPGARDVGERELGVELAGPLRAGVGALQPGFVAPVAQVALGVHQRQARRRRRAVRMAHQNTAQMLFGAVQAARTVEQLQLC